MHGKNSLNERYSFEYYDDLIVYMIKNGYMLETGEIYHISFHLAKGVIKH